MARLPYVQGALVVLAVGIAPAQAESPAKSSVKAPTAADIKAADTKSIDAKAAAKPAVPQPAVTAQWPKTVPSPADVKPAAAWSETEVATALAQCKTLLTGLQVVAVPAAPMREGECGAPAPVELISIGSNPQVTLSQPAIVTCEFVVALDKWLKAEVQPAARELLGSPIIRIDVMSAYSCRNAYGRKKSRLSEHGRANALDIKQMLTERGMVVDIQADWGPTERDIKARIAAAAAAAKAAEAKADAIKREAEKVAAQQAKPKVQPGVSPPNVTTGSVTPAPEVADAPLKGSVEDKIGHIELRQGARSWREVAPGTFSLQPSRLGGPKSAANDAATPKSPHQTDQAKSKFLRRIHAGACRTFTTILGPEANEAHRNHFHVDVAARQLSSYCE